MRNKFGRFKFSVVFVTLVWLVALGVESDRAPTVHAQGPNLGNPEVAPLVGPVSLDRDLRTLPYAPPTDHARPRLGRYPLAPEASNTNSPASPASPNQPQLPALNMPNPSTSFGGITLATSGCGCLPPDTDGDVGPNHYIQSVNSSIEIFNKSGTALSGPTTYNSFFSALGTSTPCGNNQNEGDGIVFYDHIAGRWVVSDFAFNAASAAGPYYQCIGVSKTSDPVAGGWWLYALQHDSANVRWLGDYPKFGLWLDAYYLSVNVFDLSLPAASQFQGVRVYALNRSAMLNGTGAPSTPAIAFTILPATLGNTYSLLPATFRRGAPPAGTPEYFLAINSSPAGGTIENQVFAWRFHVDFVTPANSTFGVGASHAANGAITVNNFVEAMQGSGATLTTNLVPQTGTPRLLDTLGDKLMYPLYYQNRSGVESLYAVHTVNNNQGGTGPTALRWYQFNVTGSTIPGAAAQQQTFDNAADGLWRWMPSLAVDANADLAMGYTTSSSAINPGIRYAGRLASDPANSLAQGEAVLINGGGHQTHSSGRWGDYSAMSIDPVDGCTFWHTNEYFSATSSASWNTRIGSFVFPSCGTPTAVTLSAFEARAGEQTSNWGIPGLIIGIIGALALAGIARLRRAR